jgi:hypothetical protein
VRSRDVRILEEENFVLNKKRECEREEEEWVPMRGYRQNGVTYAGAL